MVIFGGGGARRQDLEHRVGPQERHEAPRGGAGKEPLSPSFGSPGHDTSLFFRLVLGCIETKFRNQIRILQHFSKSTKLSS